MSWETFKQNILRVSNNPDAINNIEVVADAYAKEYDAAIKNGFDSIHKTRVQNGDVESMKRFFISALQKGLTSTQPYDLVGEMGEGVKAYWATVTLGNEVVPTIPAPGSFQNIGVQTNRATVFGVWKKPITITEVNFELTDIERAEYQERLERAITKREEALNQGKIDEADTFLDAINAYTDCLTQNQKYNVPLDQLPPVLQPKTDVPITGSITQPISQTGNTGTNENGNSSTNEITTTTVTKDDDSFIDFDAPVTNTRDVIKEYKFTDGKPFVSGFKAGGFTAGFNGATSVDLGPLNFGADWVTLAAQFIGKNEGFAARASWDYNAYRLGFGSDKILGADGRVRDVLPPASYYKQTGEKQPANGDTTTVDAALKMLQYEIAGPYKSRLVGTGTTKISEAAFNTLNNKQRAALVSFVYNCGSLKPAIAAAINGGNLSLAAQLIAAGPITAGGEVLPGLVRRRKEEATLFST